MTFVLQRTAPVFALKSKERRDRLSSPSMLSFREIMTNGLFESNTRVVLKKPDFFFGDVITEEDRVLHNGDYKWLRQIGGKRFFLPNTERMYPLSYLQHTSALRNGVGPFSVCLRRVPRQIGYKRSIPCWPQKKYIQFISQISQG